jgi:hypothetical protein
VITIVTIKQTWWRQIFDAKFLAEQPKIKAISFFEFIKFEEDSWRDFTTFGGDQHMVSPLGNDGTAQDQLVLAAFRKDLQDGMGDLIMWANKTEPKPTPTDTPRVPQNNALIAEWLDTFLAALFSWAIFA